MWIKCGGTVAGYANTNKLIKLEASLDPNDTGFSIRGWLTNDVDEWVYLADGFKSLKDAQIWLDNVIDVINQSTK